MGAFDSWFGKRSDDPLQELDPKVREFLKKESPLKIESKKPAGQEDGGEPATPAQAQADAATAEDAAAAAPGVPKQSQYQDGRYAHLWKTYRPLSEIENETKSDHERLSDVLEAYKGRKAAIGSAALENCAVEQFDWSNCMKSGTLKARVTMCRDEVRKFEQCYNMQTKLLKVLGYLNAADKTPEMDERIQMHADKLYHQWLAQDEAAAKAKAEGAPAPKFEPVVPQQMVDDAATATASSPDEVVEMSEGARKRLQERLAQLDERERETEKAAVEAEMRSKKEMIATVQGVWKEAEAQREARRQKGEETLWDRMTSAFRTSGSDGNKS